MDGQAVGDEQDDHQGDDEGGVDDVDDLGGRPGAAASGWAGELEECPQWECDVDGEVVSIASWCPWERQW